MPPTRVRRGQAGRTECLNWLAAAAGLTNSVILYLSNIAQQEKARVVRETAARMISWIQVGRECAKDVFTAPTATFLNLSLSHC